MTEQRANIDGGPTGKRHLSPGEAQRIQMEWETGKPVHHFFPIRFDCGTEASVMEASCCCCKGPIRPEAFRGKVTRPTGDTAIIEAWGVCEECLIWVPFYVICRGDPFQLEWFDPDDGWRIAKARWAHPLRAVLRQGVKRLWNLLLFRR